MRRKPAPIAAPTSPGVYGSRLADAAPGTSSRIVGFAETLPTAVRARLCQLGFRPGCTVETVRRAPLGDPVVYRVCNSEMCLRRSEAALVLVDDAAG